MRALLCILAAIALYGAGGLYGSCALMAAGIALALAVAFSWLAAHRLARRLAVRLECRAAEVSHGETAAVDLVVQNTAHLPLCAFEATLESRLLDVDEKPAALTVFGTLAARRSMTIPLLREAAHCGVLETRCLRIAARGPLGLCSAALPVQALTRTTVVPRPADGPQAAVAHGAAEELALGEQARTAPSAGLPPDVRELRAWQAGDALHAVHWKLSARGRGLVTRAFEDEGLPGIVILLDPAAHAEERADEMSGAERADAWYAKVRAVVEALAEDGMRLTVVWWGRVADVGGVPGGGDESARRGVREFLVERRSDAAAFAAELVASDGAGRGCTVACDDDARRLARMRAGAGAPHVLDGSPARTLTVLDDEADAR